MKTAIVIGAGASQPFGLPLGSQLKQIITQFVVDHSVRTRLNQLGYDASHLEELTECLRYGRYQTIDEFLDAKKSFREVGGYIIAEAILNQETRDNIFPARDWLAGLFAKLHKKIIEKEALDLSLVTLNYDRTIEYFFSKVTKYDCREEEEAIVAEELRNIPIIHPHGSLGSLEELPFGMNGGPREARQVREAGKRIQIISDKLEDSPAYVSAKQLLSESERILFIGSAYHPSTMNSLLNGIDLERTELIGTSMGLSKERTDAVNDWSKSRLQLRPTTAHEFVTHIVI